MFSLLTSDRCSESWEGPAISGLWDAQGGAEVQVELVVQGVQRTFQYWYWSSGLESRER